MTELPISMSVLTMIVAALLGVVYGRRLHARGLSLRVRVRIRDLPLIPLSIVVLVGSLYLTNYLGNRPHLFWYIPTPIEYRLTPALWALKLIMVIFAFTSVVTVAVLFESKGRRTLIAISVITAFSVEGLARYAHRPTLPPLVERTRDGGVLQTSPATCAPAACATIAIHFGHQITEAEMAGIFNTTADGTTPSQIIYGMRSLGFEVHKKYSPARDPNDITPPAVLMVAYGAQPDGHAIVYMGPSGGAYEIWNPQFGRALQTLEALQRKWQGRAIEIAERDRSP